MSTATLKNSNKDKYPADSNSIKISDLHLNNIPIHFNYPTYLKDKKLVIK